jgi:hypothetical protein
LEADGIVGPITLDALGTKIKLASPEIERKEFSVLLLKNPNYFGDLKDSKFLPVKKITGNTPMRSSSASDTIRIWNSLKQLSSSKKSMATMVTSAEGVS